MATTNLNLNTLAGTEKLKSFPTPYNENMGAIDDAFGSGFGVGNNSSVDDELNGLGKGMAIIANGNTHAAITSGQYVYVRQHGSLSEGLYKATANISANGTLSGSNLTAVSSGGLNDVRESIPVIVDNLTTNDSTKTLSAAQGYALNGNLTSLSAEIYSRTFNYSNYKGDSTTYDISLPKNVNDGGTYTYLAYFRHYNSSTSWTIDEYVISVVNYVPYCTVVVKNSSVNISNAVLSSDHTKVTLTLDRAIYMQVSAVAMF